MQTSGVPIQHTGFVIATIGQKAVIQLMQAATCSSCSAKGVCGVSESDKKTFEVDNQGFEKGQLVSVEITSAMAMKALITAYLIPFLIVFGSLILLISIGVSEGLSGLIALLTVPLYYLITRSLLSNNSSQYNLTIKKL